MGTKVHCKSYLPGYYSMTDLNEDSRNSSWPLFYGDKTLATGQYYNGFFPRAAINAYPGYDKYGLKQTMLEHEAVFKHQVFELHRLYKIQKDMMDEIRRKELHMHQIPVEASSSSSLLVSQMPSEDGRKWHRPTFPLMNSVCGRPSVSGAEIISSTLSCTEGSSTQAGRIPFQNGCSSRDCEILELRPSKVRKKLFDLRLPADEYIDTEEGEQSVDTRKPDFSSYPPSGNHKIASEGSVKLNLGGSAKIDCDGNASRSDSCLRTSVGLADLNEPLPVEEAIPFTSVNSIGCATGHGESKDLCQASKPNSQFLLGIPREISQTSQHGSSSGTLNNIQMENKGHRKEWLSYIYEAGHSKAHLNSISEGLQLDKSPMSSQLTRVMLNKAHKPLGIPPSDIRRGDLWREGTICSLELPEKCHDLSSFNHLEPVVTSHMPNTFPLVHSSELDNSWSHCISTLGKPSSSLTQKWTAVQTQPPLSSLGSLSRSSHPSAHSHEIFGDQWHLHSSSGSKLGFSSGLPNHNGFYNGSSSGSKDVPTRLSSVGFDYLNCNKDDKVVSEHLTNYGPGSYMKGSNVIDVKSVKDVNLNTVLSKCSSSEVVAQQGLEIVDEERKCEDHLKILPWLRAKPACKNEDASTKRDSHSSEISLLQAASNHSSGKGETVKGPNQISAKHVTLASCEREVGAKRHEVVNCLASRKILGFPIFNNPATPKNESSSLVSTSASLRCTPLAKETKNEGKIGVIDINLACDPESSTQIAEVVSEKEKDKKVANFRTLIDLNSSVSEDEVTLAPSVASTKVNVKIAVEIDLEAPAFLETEEEDIPAAEEQKQQEMPQKPLLQKDEQPQDEAVRIAAQAIVAFSSWDHLNHVEESTCHPTPTEAPSPDPLLWFAEVVSSHPGNLDSKFGTESKGKGGGDKEVLSFSDEIDYFEAMTLNLRELKEEEYMPKPLVPENLKVEETGTVSLPNRSRKGQARRGRQRRDFQRDILPGLASLSRHEVTEDLQTFGGLMRATGHSWHSGLNRRNGTRNGGGRGRRRSVVVDPESSPSAIPAPAPAPAVAATAVWTPLMQQLNNIEVGLEDRSLTGWGKTPRRPRRQRCPAGNPPPIPLA